MYVQLLYVTLMHLIDFLDAFLFRLIFAFSNMQRKSFKPHPVQFVLQLYLKLDGLLKRLVLLLFHDFSLVDYETVEKKSNNRLTLKEGTNPYLETRISQTLGRLALLTSSSNQPYHPSKALAPLKTSNLLRSNMQNNTEHLSNRQHLGNHLEHLSSSEATC